MKTISSLRQTSSAKKKNRASEGCPENTRTKSLVFLETAIQDRNPGIRWRQAAGKLKATLSASHYLPDLYYR